MTQPSPVSPLSPAIVDNDNQSQRNFVSLIKHWMGRIISTCFEMPSRLSNLIFKVHSAAKPIVQDDSSPLSTPVPGKKVEAQKVSTSSDKKVPSPLHKRAKSAVSDDEVFDADSESSISLVADCLNKMGLAGEVDEIISQGIFFDLTGKKLGKDDLKDLTGEYQVEWNIGTPPANVTLLYRGHLENGLFHGKGAFLKQESNGALYNLIEGNFNKGRLSSGTIVIDDSVVEGTFKNGTRDGKGIIRFFNTETVTKSIFTRYEYHGEFLDCIPNGQGKVLTIESDLNAATQSFTGSVKLLAEGTFDRGRCIKGHLYEVDGRIFIGAWNDDDFDGEVRDYDKQSVYKGKCVNGDFHGTGVLKYTQEVYYDALEAASFTDDPAGQDEVVLVSKKDMVECTYSGQFNKGDRSNGELVVKWKEGKLSGMQMQQGTYEYRDGKITRGEIFTTTGFTYIGQFKDFSLDGMALMYNEAGILLYTGEIKCGYPHGKGKSEDTDDEKGEDGYFEWGKFVGTKPPAPTKDEEIDTTDDVVDLSDEES